MNILLALVCVVVLGYNSSFASDLEVSKNRAFEVGWSDGNKARALSTFKEAVDSNIDFYCSNTFPGVCYYIDKKTNSLDTVSVNPSCPEYSTLAEKLYEYEKVVFTYKSGKQYNGYYDRKNKIRIVMMPSASKPQILYSQEDNSLKIAKSRGEEIETMTKR